MDVAFEADGRRVAELCRVRLAGPDTSKGLGPAHWLRRTHPRSGGSDGFGILHKDIVAEMCVTRATVSGLMAALEREGLVKSHADRQDRRKLIARLTPKGEAVIRKAFEVNFARFRAAFASLSEAELTRLRALLHRFSESFPSSALAPKADVDKRQ